MQPNETSHARGAVVDVALHGELDVATHAEVVDAVRAALAESPAEIRLDLSGVAFIDCAGLTALLAAQAAAERASCLVRMTQWSAAVHRVLALTDMRERFGITAG